MRDKMEFRDAGLRIRAVCPTMMMNAALMVLLHHWIVEYLMCL